MANECGHRAIQIAVIGAGECSGRVAQLAEEVGAEIGRRRATLVCGGMGGVMEAVASGTRRAGGLTVGILPTYDDRSGSRSLDVVIPTGFGHGRNVIVVAAGDAVIALSGEHGTASEIALAFKLGRSVVGLQAWQNYPGVVPAQSPAEAVELAIAFAAGRRQDAERQRQGGAEQNSRLLRC
jgi:uncharacterized protein (TIGR00725 family)